MKRITTFFALALALMLTARCDYDDTELWNKVNDHEERLAALEQWQAEVNNNIAALQTLLNTNDMITGITPVTMGDEVVGYTISFLHSDPVTIYNGEKGETGEAGQDGETPQIGLTEGDDGNWYWTLNGSLMTDADGNPIRANGEDGKDGQDGEDGEDGEDGRPGSTGGTGASAPAPQIKLGSMLDSGAKIMTDEGVKDDAAWYLSVNGGTEWYRVSGQDGDAMFSGEPELSDDGAYYIFTLADGDQIFVAAYRALTFEGINLDKPNGVNGTLAIGYTVVGMESANVAPSINGEDWEATPSDGTITVTAGTAAEAQLTITVSDNKGYSTSYIISLYKYEYDEDANTYTVYNADGLRAWADAVQTNLSTNCTLAADIDMTGEEWIQVGGTSNDTRFSGTFDGGGHTISNMKAAYPLIYAAEEATIQDVVLVSPEISVNSGNNAGGILGVTYEDVTLLNCHVVGGSIKNANYTGGIVGSSMNHVSIYACSSTAEVTGKTYVGGIIGGSTIQSMIACYYAGKLIGSGVIGGIMGQHLNDGTFSACYWSGDVEKGVGSGNISGVTKVENGNWDDAMKAMNQALQSSEYSQYKWVKNEGEDASTRPLIIEMGE